jgi:hypothetical protein
MDSMQPVIIKENSNSGKILIAIIIIALIVYLLFFKDNNKDKKKIDSNKMNETFDGEATIDTNNKYKRAEDMPVAEDDITIRLFEGDKRYMSNQTAERFYPLDVVMDAKNIAKNKGFSEVIIIDDKYVDKRAASNIKKSNPPKLYIVVKNEKINGEITY